MTTIQIKDLNSDNSSMLLDLNRAELNTVKGGGVVDFVGNIINGGKQIFDGGKQIFDGIATIIGGGKKEEKK